jgi:RNA polymerase sigma factor (sigma-70 family)
MIRAEPTDGELLAGDSDFAVFYARHVQAVTSFVAVRVARPDLVFDLVSETFARALEHRAKYDSQRGPGIAWLVGIARHLIADAARRGRVDADARRRLGMPRVALDDEQLALIERRGSIDFRAALSALQPDQQEAVMRYVLADEPYRLIAERVGCSEQVVRKRVSRGLALMRRSLEGQAP